LYAQNITTPLKEVKQKAPAETFSLITVQVGYFLAKG
jgi:hypothetical protein